MDYTLAELDTCMFLYLAQNQDKPISIYSMWNQLTSKTGYHCEELTIQHKQQFITQFNCLPSIYNNIIKFYKNGTPYLVSTKLESWQFDQDKYVPQEQVGQFCTVDDLVESYISENVNDIEDEFILWLIKHNKVEQITKIFDNYSFEHEEYELFLKEAKDNAKILALLLKHKYKNKILQEKTKQQELKERNRYLEQENVRLTRRANSEFSSSNYYRSLLQASIPLYLVLTYMLKSYVC
jgi:hypothetical protein